MSKVLPELARTDQKAKSSIRHVNYFLRSIINAYQHPDRNVTPEIRLARAREALFGEKSSNGRSEMDDELALFHMMGEIHKSELDALRGLCLNHSNEDRSQQIRQEIEREALSQRASADKFSPLTPSSSNTSKDTSIERLRKKIRANELTSQDLVDLEGLIHNNSPKSKLIAHILDELKLLGINYLPPVGELDT